MKGYYFQLMHPLMTALTTYTLYSLCELPIHLVNFNHYSAVKEHEKHRAQSTNMIKLLEEKLKDQEGIINRLEQVR